MDIQLDYAVPGNESEDLLTLFYRFRANVPIFEDVERADHAQIRFRLTPGAGEYRFADGNVQTPGAAHVVGPTTGAFRVRVEGPVLLFGAGITPLGWMALIGSDASSLVNRVVDLADLFGDTIDEGVAEMARLTELDEMVACGESIVRRLVRVRRSREVDFIHMVDAWLSDDASPEIESLVAAAGMSARQIERKCKTLYGASPKGLARKYRALRAAVSLVSEGASIDDVVSRGFYDQSHLIREIKHFTGYTPGQIRAEPSLLAQLTIARRTALEGVVHPIISGT
ncbi:helix-turn-helix transcriptional regulator [Sphingomonas sp. RS6]